MYLCPSEKRNRGRYLSILLSSAGVESRGKMAFSYLLKSGLKLGIVGGAVYGTINVGLWGNSEQSIDAYNKLKTYVPREYVETVKEKVKVPKIPIDDYMKKSFREYWNSGVLCTFYGISVLPAKVSHYSKLAWEKANEALNEPAKVDSK